MEIFFNRSLARKLAIGLVTGVTVASSSLASAQMDDQAFAKAIEKYLASDTGQMAVGKAADAGFRKLRDQMRKDEESRDKAEMEEQFKNPIKIEVGNSPVKGPANAKVTIVEFSDFQCPFCQMGANNVEQVLKKYPNDVKLVFKNLPLPMHAQAKPAAKAALAANKQGKFWEFHDAFFANQQKLGPAFFEQKAKDLGLDMDRFKKDMESPELDKQVDEEMALAQQHGVMGTPGFIVGGVAVKGARPPEYFDQIIQRVLKGS